MRKLPNKRAFSLPLMFLASSCAFANYACEGSVKGLSINTAGNIIAESVAGVPWGYLCSVVTTQNNVDPQTCKTVYAALLAAELSGQNVELWFNDTMTCATHPQYQWLTGWYSGPAVSP